MSRLAFGRTIVGRLGLWSFWLVAAVGSWGLAEEPKTGPSTEKRFPPLVVPEGFRATLFACDPLVEYPSVIALGPRPGTLFVAHDYLTGLGVDIVRRDEVRLIADSDGDGYADRSTVYAGEFHSIQGLAYHDGTVFVMHAPLLTALRDTDGDGVADERRDLLDGLGLAPENNSTRLHCANGVTVGHDGWLYLAMGDNGTDVQRPEGDRLVLHEGGILRCRPDGRDLHVFSAGLRNIYDIALDEELNVFVRDNENDGGDYMIRVCYSFFGADHGYPYLYYEHPDEALRPLADLGRGSSAGGASYLETAFPEEFRGDLFFCEWGRSVVRYRRQPAASHFAAMQELEFARGPANDPYGFKPTDIVVDYDGSLLVSDWCDGQRPKRGRARIYRIAYSANGEPTGEAPRELSLEESLLRLDAPNSHERTSAQRMVAAAGETGRSLLRQRMSQLGPLGRMHAVWILSQGEREAALTDLFAIAASDTDPRVRVQAIRAIADLADPVLLHDRLDGGPGDPALAARIAELAGKADPRVKLAAVVAMGRLRWPGAPGWLREHLHEPDSALAHAALQTLRRCGNWTAVLAWLDEPDDRPLRAIALRALAEQADPQIVAGLITRLDSEPSPPRRSEYVDLLARVHRVPGPWTYWGYRPGPRPADSQDWQKSERIAEALNERLADPEVDVRMASLRGMQREKVPMRLAPLAQWLRDERSAERVTLILDSLATLPAAQTRGILADIVAAPAHEESSRRRALGMYASGLPADEAAGLGKLAQRVEDGPIGAAVLSELRERPVADGGPLLVVKLNSPVAAMRAAALDVAAAWKLTAVSAHLPRLLGDEDRSVRRAAASAAGALGATETAPVLVALTGAADPPLRAASLTALTSLRYNGAVPEAVELLRHSDTQLAALRYLRAFGSAEQLSAIVAAGGSRSIEVLQELAGTLLDWQQRLAADSQDYEALEQALARVHGDGGLLLAWRVISAPADELPAFAERWSVPSSRGPAGAAPALAAGRDSKVTISRPQSGADPRWLARTALHFDQPTRLQLLGSSNRPWRIWFNGKLVYERDKSEPYSTDAERVDVEAPAGTSRLVAAWPGEEAGIEFQLRVRRVSSSADHERLTRLVLQEPGNLERGRALFADAEKTQCAKCHRLQGQGGTIGPDLTGIGRRFSRIHLVESILEPSRAIAPSYESITVALADGRVVTGVRVSETVEALTLGDERGEVHRIAHSEIDERSLQARSTMPEGLEKRLTDREFLDLVAYLSSL